jgi:hypothetical protein
MKINVTGRGKVPGINAIAPVYNREADEKLIRRILAFRVFRVFDCESGCQITSKNISEFINRVASTLDDAANDTTKPNITVPQLEKKTINPIPKTDIPVEPTVPPVITEDEITVDESVYEVDDTTTSDVVVAETTIADDTADVIEAVEDNVDNTIEIVDDVIVTEDAAVDTDADTTTKNEAYRPSKRSKRKHH